MGREGIGRGHRAVRPPVVTLYARAGCHLCDEAREALQAMAPVPAPFELHEVDIESDERLLRTYLERIPVVEVDGEIVSELVFDPRRLRRKLESLAAAAPPETPLPPHSV
jgi:glutaredoxin